MPRNFNTNTDNNDEWLTPPAIIAALGPFDLDPCSPIHRPWDTAKRHFTRLDDGLSMPWSEERERERERESGSTHHTVARLFSGLSALLHMAMVRR